MSSGKRRFAVRPGGGLVVEGAGRQAAVQDADQPVSQSPESVTAFESCWPGTASWLRANTTRASGARPAARRQARVSPG